MYEEFVRNRISQLRIAKGVSEYKMSYDLGHSRGYIYNISSGKALPPMTEFFAICNYFGITPGEFFEEDNCNPKLINDTAESLKCLNEKDLTLVCELIERLKEKK